MNEGDDSLSMQGRQPGRVADYPMVGNVENYEAGAEKADEEAYNAIFRACLIKSC